MTPGASNPGMVACTPCRAVKMKCIREPDSTICTRCKRKSLSCYFEAHRRGRKAGTKLRPKAERTKGKDAHEQRYPIPSTPSTERDTTVNVTPVERSEPSLASDSLAPFGLLGKSATAGKFSIANVLNAEEQSPVCHATDRRGSYATEDAYVDDMDDPVNLNLIDLPTARKLYTNFFQYMNPFICQFDPKLHTIKYIRTRSSFLFSALLSAAAKIFLPSLYMKLHDHVESILKEILITGKASTEIVQGICLLTYWKEPSDSRAWGFVGYAIRACIGMGWDKLNSACPDSSTSSMPKSTEREIEIRELRNKERTWLMLFVYDRSVSLQLGKPWMIHMNPLIRNSDSWHQHIYAVPGCDQIMSAFVQLRILGSDILDLFWIDPVATTAQSITKNEVILKLFNGDLDRWEAKWYKIVEDASVSVAHRFIIRFYGTHLRLLLHSFRLQLSILSGNISKQALWVCYTSSLDMLRLVVDRLGITVHSSCCQDSVHVMVAYAAVLMIKILLSLPGELPTESENLILDLISETSQNFSRQHPAPNTSSYYQSKFLANVVAQYRKSKDETSSAANQWLRQQHQMLEQPEKQSHFHHHNHNLSNNISLLPPPSQQHGGYSGSQLSNSPRQTIVSISPSTASRHAPGHTTIHQQTSQSQELPYQFQNPISPTYSQHHHPHLHSHLNQLPQPPQPANSHNNLCTNNVNKAAPTSNILTTTTHNNLETFMAMDGQSNAIPLFTPNTVWEDMFTHLGFNISSGAFVPKLAEGQGLGS
ncbi:hypothetical protein AJ79_08296 [Helicocarpus griseus UAMH5409]|uniref:Zn(2)-C6 fungal-type domain-containing protein n=1 Tax=Helicocarpus griseus UAMH5409 TaxID=1447875 RepID=A0A2B7WU31_9EURO|nr:hypothetical protein AJ79_08296 [Helicocarpus griseus UAMH5409]